MKISSAVVFADTTRTLERHYLKKASIHTAEMTSIKTALKEIQKTEDKRWIIYTDLLCSMLAIENRKSSNIKSDIRHTSKSP